MISIIEKSSTVQHMTVCPKCGYEFDDNDIHGRLDDGSDVCKSCFMACYEECYDDPLDYRSCDNDCLMYCVHVRGDAMGKCQYMLRPFGATVKCYIMHKRYNERFDAKFLSREN